MPSSATTQPKLIFVSPCVPDRHGSAARRRAWRLIEAASHHYRITLAMRVDGPMHVHQWRRLASLCEELAVAPPGRAGIAEVLKPTIQRSAEAGALAVVALGSSIWPVTADVALTRILDLGADKPHAFTMPGLGWADPLRVALRMRDRRRAAATCDLLTLERREDRLAMADVSAPIHIVSEADTAAWLEVLAQATEPGRLAKIMPTVTPTRRAA